MVVVEVVLVEIVVVVVVLVVDTPQNLAERPICVKQHLETLWDVLSEPRDGSDKPTMCRTCVSVVFAQEGATELHQTTK